MVIMVVTMVIIMMNNTICHMIVQLKNIYNKQSFSLYFIYKIKYNQV